MKFRKKEVSTFGSQILICISKLITFSTKKGLRLETNILSQKIVQSIIFQMNYFQIDGGKPPVIKNAHTKHVNISK